MFWWLISLLIAGGMSYFLLTLKPTTLRKIGNVIPPSIISIVHCPVILVGYFVIYLRVNHFVGIVFTVFGGIMDSMDGKIGRAFELLGKTIDPKTFRKSLSHLGCSKWGEKIDPFMDKMSSMPIYSFHVGWGYYNNLQNNNLQDELFIPIAIGFGLIILIIITDLLGIFIRLDYCKNRGWLKKAKSGKTGKYKSLLQLLWLAIYAPAEQGWIPDYLFNWHIYLTLWLSIICIFAIHSLASKIQFSKNTSGTI
ncbi:CDP-alcohol phosphatidyltransferase family protein [Candidatus Peregrinibacteria bacterium]|nr:CDP-alcohol phosphatidyltransferase family protein [Candidatus Peregrinibacteria bacterium]